MHPFFVGFLITFILLLVAFLFLRITVPYATKLFGSNPIPYKSFKESTDWLNFILYRVLTHFQTAESIQRINELVTSKIKFAKFNLLSLGRTPQIPSVSTLKMKDQNDIKILIPLSWENGPSFDISLLHNNIVFESDLVLFKGTLLVSWPPNNEINVELRFVGDIQVDFEVCVLLFNKYRFSITQLPLFGPIIKGILPFILTKRSIIIKAELSLPPNLN